MKGGGGGGGGGGGVMWTKEPREGLQGSSGQNSSDFVISCWFALTSFPVQILIAKTDNDDNLIAALQVNNLSLPPSYSLPSILLLPPYQPSAPFLLSLPVPPPTQPSCPCPTILFLLPPSSCSPHRSHHSWQSEMEAMARKTKVRRAGREEEGEGGGERGPRRAAGGSEAAQGQGESGG